MHLLVVEDDPRLGRLLQRLLEDDRHLVELTDSGETAAETIEANRELDAVILDLGLPDISGIEVAQRVRRAGVRTPMLILTARDAIEDRVAGLDAGADDYIVKPYDTDELLARVRALLRRSAARGEPLISHKGLELNPATREAALHGQPLSLTPREWALLEPMLQRPGAVFSKAQLEQKLYSWKDDISSNAVEVYVHGLRKKLGQDFIRTVRGLGYVVPRD